MTWRSAGRLALLGSLGACARPEAEASVEAKAEAAPQPAAAAPSPEAEPERPRVRVAVFNVALVRSQAGELRRDLEGGHDAQAREIAAILQRVRPDIVLLLEVDRDPEALAVFERDLLGVRQPEGAEPLRYEHRFVPEVNTGVPSGLDLDRDGSVGGPGDALGYGGFPGHYGMAVLSRFPIDPEQVRCLGDLRWRDVPGAQLPDDRDTPAADDWYSCTALNELPLSSKNHCIVPVEVGPQPLLALISHPVPPVFDGPEDRNGRRNHDEIRLWAQVLDGTPGLPTIEPGARFVLLGDLNADPHDGDTRGNPVERWLLDHPRIDAGRIPASKGAEVAAQRDGGINETHRGLAAHDTADFPEAGGGPGNLRVDYALPSTTLQVLDAGVFWPAPGQPGASLVEASDHRLVWIDVR